jgi:leucyl-tRNA synthetase
MMEFLNQLNSFEPSEESDFAVLKEGILTLVHLLFPVAPHFSEEIYLQLDGGAPSLYEIAWPGYEEKLTQDDEITYAVQVNGKVRANIEMAADSAKDEVLNVAKAHENIIKYLEGKEIVREIFVPKKLVNLVVK